MADPFAQKYWISMVLGSRAPILRLSALLPEYAQQAYDAAIGPKELLWMETHNHIELYDHDPYVSEACRRIVSWLARYVKP